MYWEQASRSRIEAYRSINTTDLNILRNARQRVAAEIAALQRTTATFDRILHDFSPVHALPTEVLVRCFEILSWGAPLELHSSDRQRHNLYKVPRHPLGWITVTHVCQRWREIALSQSSLWSLLSPSLGPHWFPEVMARARSSPLTVFCRDGSQLQWMDFDMSSVLLDALISHRDTLHTVDINDFRIPSRTGVLMVQSKLHSFFAEPAPQLYKLELHIFPTTQDGVEHGVRFEIPTSLFGGYFPRLRHVSIGQVRGSWLSMPFKGLTTLYIGQLEPLASFDPLLNLLDQNPSLEYLMLVNVLPGRTMPGPGNRRIYLGHLRNIGVNASDGVSSGRLLRVLEAAPDVVIHMYYFAVTADALHTLSSSLALHISRCNAPLCRLEISFPPNGEFNLVAWRERDGEPECALELYAPMDQHFSGLDEGPAILHSLFDQLPLVESREVKLTGFIQGGPIITWRDHLPRLRKVQQFTFDEPEVIPLLCSPAGNSTLR